MVSLDGKFGYIREDGSIICSLIFESAKNFCEGHALVKFDGKYGFIKEDGSYLVAPTYERAESFWSGLAAVTLNDKTGYINTSGQLIVSHQFDFAANFTRPEFARVELNAKMGLLKLDGTIQIIDRFLI